MGMIGGGNTGFIGAVHRMAAFVDNQFELVCGCFSSDAERSLASGLSYYLGQDRIYSDFEQMIERELSLPESERMDVVSIVTPNMAHFAPAKLALESGFDVIIDKLITFSLEEALALKEIVDRSGRTLALTHTYSGYPLVKEAKYRVARGDFGAIRKIYVEYPQGWLSDRIELQSGNNAGWRTDPKRSGKAGCMGDIGTHAFHLAEYITGLRCTSMCADLVTFVEGRPLDDDGAVLLRYDNGARGVLMASQIACGEENALKIRVYGEKGGLEWSQQEPNSLILKWGDRPMEVVRAGAGYLSDIAKYNTRTPGGHPEGYVEAFANIYRNFASVVKAKANGESVKEEWLDFPTVDDGVRGMQFIETVVESGYEQNQKWVDWIN